MVLKFQNIWNTYRKSCGSNPIEDEVLLKALSNTYLQAALQQRQQRLADGLDFLNKQAPSLQTNLDQLQGELAEFRTRYSLLEPTAEGEARKNETSLAAQVLNLEAERNRLTKVRANCDSTSLPRLSRRHRHQRWAHR